MPSDSDPDDKLPPQGRFKRFRKLAGLSAQLGADFLANGARRMAGQDPEFLSKGAAEKIVATLGELKGAAMKLGQALSMDAELLSPEVRQVLARLQNQAPAMDYATVSQVVTRELGAPPERCFASFDPTPLAAASLGQVHRATLEDGRSVAVKVQYPGIERSLEGDLDNVGMVVRTVSSASRLMDGRAYFQELRRELLLELDYRREADLCERMAQAVALLPDLKIPGVIASHSTGKVLTLELLEGKTLKDWLLTEPSPDERYRVARQLIRAIYAPFFLTGDIHADPHPGNFMVMPDGHLGLLDFGAIKHFSAGFVAANRETVSKSFAKEPLDVVEICKRIGFTTEVPDAEARPLIEGLLHIAGRSVAADTYDFSTCQVFWDTKRYFAAHAPTFLKIRPPPEALLFFRATSGLAQNLRLIGAQGPFRKVYQELLSLE